MARARRVRKADTWKTKKWVDIHAPKMFGEVKIGETLASDSSNLIGRTIETTMREIAGDFSKQHIQVRFQITDVVGSKAYTKFVRHSLSRAYMRSQIRRKTTRVEGIQDIVTKDGYKLRVKTIALSGGRAQTAQEKLVRRLMNSIVKKHGSITTFEVFIQETVLGKLPARIYRAANKAYPVRRVEVKKIKVLEEPESKKRRIIPKPSVEEKEEIKPVEAPEKETKPAEKPEKKTKPVAKKETKETEKTEEPEKNEVKEVKPAEESVKKAEIPKKKTVAKKKTEKPKEEPKKKVTKEKKTVEKPEKKTKAKKEKKTETKKETTKKTKQTRKTKAKKTKKAESKK